MKRLVYIIFALVLGVFSASAQTSGQCGNNLYWTLSDSTLTITGFGAMYDYKYGETPWYSENTSISAISLPQGLTHIGDYAFYYCRSLTSITIPNSVTSIGSDAFFYCSSLTSVTIPNSVTSIGDRVFAYCSSMTSITIPNSVTSIGSCAFVDCSSLTSIVVESGNTTYDSRNSCNAIIETATNTLIVGCQNTTIPNSVTSIGSYAFFNCRSLTSITIPNSVTSIRSKAFEGCSSLTSITIPNSVTSIGESAFSYCSLTSVTVEATTPPSLGGDVFTSKPTCYIPAGTLSAYQASDWASQVGSFVEQEEVILTCVEAVEMCTSTTPTSETYTIRGYVTQITQEYISNYNNVTFWMADEVDGGQVLMAYRVQPTSTTDQAVQVGDYVEVVGSLQLYSTTPEVAQGGSYTILNASPSPENKCGDNLYWEYNDSTLTITGRGAMYDGAPWEHLKESIAQIRLPQGLTRVGAHAFAGCSHLRSFTIPNSVTSIGYEAFGYLPITTLTIPQGVTLIETYAFINCGSLTSVSLPSTLERLEGLCFQGCSSLTSITIPSSVTYMDQPFLGCSSLTSIVVESGNLVYDSRNNCNAIIETASGKLISGCSTTVIPQGVTSIEGLAFEGQTALTSITLPNSVLRIGGRAFTFCSSLNAITIPSSVQVIEETSFWGCSSLTSIVVESGNNIYDSRNNCNAIIETATNRLIAGCQNTIIPNDVAIIAGSAFRDQSNLTSITIPEGVTTIGDWSFAESGLTSIVIPNSVTNLGWAAFHGCTSLRSVVLPNSLDTIQAEMFVYCPIQSIFLPSSVKHIKHAGFYDTPLSQIYLTSPTPVTLETEEVFICGALTCYIPTGTLQAYQSMPMWQNQRSSINFVEMDLSNECGKNLYWTLQDSTLTITGSGAMYDYAFTDAPWHGERSNIAYLSLPNGLTSIGNSAFFASSLTSVTIPNSVTSIGDYAFSDCSSLTTITIPNSVTSIGKYAFSYCTSLTSITIPNTMTSIGEDAFSYCTSLTSVTVEATSPPTINASIFTSRPTCYIPAGTLAAYQASAWANQVSCFIEDIFTAKSRIFFDPGVWAGDNATLFAYTWNETTSSARPMTRYNEQLYQVEIPGIHNHIIFVRQAPSSTSFDWENVWNQTEELTIDANLYTITDWTTGEWSYYGDVMYELNGGRLPIQESKTNAELWEVFKPYFNAYYGLQRPDQPIDKVATFWSGNDEQAGIMTSDNSEFKWLGDYIHNVAALQSYTIDSETFWRYSLQSFFNATQRTSWPQTADFSQAGQPDRWRLYSLLPTTISDTYLLPIPVRDGYTFAGWYTNPEGSGTPVTTLFAGFQGTLYAIWNREPQENPENQCGDNLYWEYSGGTLTITGEGDMYDYTGSNLAPWSEYTEMITAVSLPSGITSISAYAFCHMSNLVKVSIPNTVTRIGDYAFYLCTSLTDITIPYSVISIGNYTFSGCSALSSINVNSKNTTYDSRNRCNAVIETATNTLVVGCQNSVIPTDVTAIGNGAFAGALFTTIEIPNSVTVLGGWAFDACPYLETITIPEFVTSIEVDAFRSCNSLQSVYVKAQTPPTLINSVFTSNPICYIPCGTLVAYQESAWASQVDRFIEENCEQNDTVYNAYICYGETFTWEVNGETYSSSGVYDYSVYNEAGELIHWILNLTVSPAPVTEEETITIAASELPYIWRGVTIAEAGSYVTTEQSINGCDSVIHELYLIVEANATMYNAYICYGETYTWEVNGTAYSESGTYTYSDSWTGETTAILNLTVSPAPVMDIDNVTINENELPYIWDGYTINAAGGYTYTEESIHGCDSVIHELYLTVESSGTSGLTYNVTVPMGTSACYIAGDMNGWTFTELTKVDNTHFTITIAGATTDMTYKYCSGPAWEYVEKDAYGSEISNRTYSTNDVVESWANIYQPLPTTPASDYHNFEDVSLNAQWQFIQSGQTNYWTIGTAAGSASAGSNALYITNDGYNYSYTNNSVSVSWAYIPVELETSDTISFYWKGTAESSYDNMRVYLYPENSLPTAGSSTASNDAVQVTSTYLCGYSSWQYFTGTPGVAGRYNLCFMWKNDASSGSMPIAVDEIRISQMTVPALPENQCGENLYWAYNNGTLTIGGSGAMYDSHELLSYRQQSWFPDAVTAVSLPNGMTHIGATAFADCSNLTSITIPSTVTSIGAEAFAWSGLERITLPESVQDIAEMAFVKCGKMTKFVWRGTPSTLGNVYNHMFLGCNQLDTVIAPARMWECTSANADIHTYYGFPSHIRYVEVTSGELSSNAISYIASSYESLTTLDISAVSNASLPTQAFASWTALETLHLPVNLTVIPYQMVYGCTNLSTISIPNYVQEFGNEAFSGCVKLHSIDFADGQNLLSIGQYAFYNCSTLVSVTVPEGVQTLGAYAFYNDASLVKIKLPSTLNVIGNYAFGNCQQLMKMNVAAYAPPTVSSNTFYSVPRTATVYVPESAINTYKSTYIWNEFFIESNVQDALDNIFTDSEEQVQKLLIHGQVFIIRNGKCYDLMGQEVETEM